ncbi:Pentatricopeptide repeat-containing protein [Canna indica]|uniref:Pentatricopeptide repeat-containing protein n=1 Tax=Canna indica TaxID=4628 RepID=A0AAQ3QD11_9LILI|nr:Pentatricopeptide repeat-containing protein [Canna indica]
MKAAANILKLVAGGLYTEALALYARLHSSAFLPDAFTFPPLLKACGKLQSPAHAQQIHAHVITHGLHTRTHATTALTAAYMQLRLFEDALKVFDSIPSPGLPSFNAVISGFSRHGCFEELVRMLKRLGSCGLRPNSVTIASVLPACATLKQGMQLHGYSLKAGHDADDFVATALVTMYLNCSELDLARQVFDLIPEKKVAGYNAMISGSVRNAAFASALNLFRQMIVLLQPNSSTLLPLLSVCSELSALQLGKQIHCYILRSGLGYDVKLGTTLIDMYSKCDMVEQAYQVFMQMENRNLVTWNSIISVFLHHGNVQDALDMFKLLRLEGFSPDTTTWNTMISGFSKLESMTEALKFFTLMQAEHMAPPSLECITSLLQAFTSVSDIRHGKEMHCHVLRTREDYVDEVFLTTLIDMYMKCGCSIYARRIFDSTGRKSKDPALWNAMISGYGRNGESDNALEIFREMQEQKVKPSHVTYLTSISACSHNGQVEKGIEIFRMMTVDHGINPSIKHFSCLIDLLGRAGKLAEAWNLIHEIPKPSASAYSALLGACGCHGDTELGKIISERLSEIEPTCSTSPVVLSNIYAARERWGEVEGLRTKMMNKELYKKPGCTWIEA